MLCSPVLTVLILHSRPCQTVTECSVYEWDTLWQSQGGSVTRSGLNMRTLPFSLLSLWHDWWWAFGFKPFVIGWTLKAKWSPWEGRWEAELQGGDREVVITKGNSTDDTSTTFSFDAWRARFHVHTRAAQSSASHPCRPPFSHLWPQTKMLLKWTAWRVQRREKNIVFIYWPAGFIFPFTQSAFSEIKRLKIIKQLSVKIVLHNEDWRKTCLRVDMDQYIW